MVEKKTEACESPLLIMLDAMESYELMSTEMEIKF